MNYKIKIEFDDELVKLKEIVKKINRDNKSQNKKFEWIFHMFFLFKKVRLTAPGKSFKNIRQLLGL